VTVRSWFSCLFGGLLAVVLCACWSGARWPLLPQHVAQGSPPPIRSSLRGAHMFVVFEDAHLHGGQLFLTAIAWPGRAPRSITLLADCTAGPGVNVPLQPYASNHGDGFSVSAHWTALCPSQPPPERASIAVELIDICVQAQCETVKGVLEVGPPQLWPAPREHRP
jgi:hypothetical protein